MPLYMDLHKGVHGMTRDEMDHAHKADLNVQNQFDARIRKFWVNEEAGTLFCLIEAPNKEACKAVHSSSHGFSACEIIEVKPSDFLLIMGEGDADDIGQALHTDGQYDSSVRTFLFTDIVGSTDLTQRMGDVKAMTILRKHNEIVRNSLLACEGKEVKHTGDGIMACFFSAVNAVNASIQIQKDLQIFRDKNPEYPLNIRIGLNTGEPVTEGGDFFGVAVQLASRICNKAESCQVLVSNIVKELCMGKGIQFQDMGQAKLKGFNLLIPIYEVNWQVSR